MSEDFVKLGDDRLSTTDKSGRRIFLHPAEVVGFFRKKRTVLQVFLIIVFLLTPWIRFHDLQLVLLDIPHRKFILFGLLFQSHNAPLIFLLLAIGTLSLAFMTALWGRVWCGWACPQTVFIDGVYRRIEKLVLGNYIERRKLQKEAWSLKKFYKFSLLWFLFFIVSALIAHSFAAYFVGSHEVLQMVQHAPSENWHTFLLVMFITFVLMFDFGWFREQFCIIACPYGRIQSVLMDDQSTTVVYDYQRGEPRKGSPVVLPAKVGDCVNCRRCVEVCPTGIDIRRGVQMECIGCTACIDACDAIMEKVNKPKGLIRYSSEWEIQNKKQFSKWQVFKKPRLWIYLSLIFVAMAVLTSILFTRKDLQLDITKGKGAPYSTNGSTVINQFVFHMYNQSYHDQAVSVELPKDILDKNITLIMMQKEFFVKAGDYADANIFVQFPSELSKGTGEFKIPVEITVKEEKDEMTQLSRELTIVGPF